MSGTFPKGCWILACLLISLSEALEIKSCATNGALQVEESSKDVLLACEGLSLFHSTTWLYQGRHPLDVQTVITNCTGSTCVSVYNVLITSSINQHTRRSHMILPDVLRDRFPDGTWWCQNGGQSAQCALDVIHKPDDSHCSVTIDEGTSMVTGECQISKMFSSHGDYSCTWFEGTDNQTEVEVQQSLTQLSLTNCSEGALHYVCGNCSFQKSLPLTAGGYSYRAVISPGHVLPVVRHVVIPKQTSGASSTPTVSVGPSTSSATQMPTVNVGTASDSLWTLRLQGLGMGIVVAGVVITIVFVAISCRRRHRRRRPQQKERQCGDTLGDIQITVGHHSPADQHPADQHLGVAMARLSAMARTSAMDNDYSTIDPPQQHGVREQSPRQLPALPAESTVAVDNTDSTYLTPTQKEPKPEVGRGYMNTAYWEGGRQDSELFPHNGYDHMSPPCSTSAGSGARRKDSVDPLDQNSERDKRKEREDEEKDEEKPEDTERAGGGKKEDRKSEEDENRRNEHTENQTELRVQSAFQEKGADYIYFRNAGIPLSEPI